ncbi:MAG: tetratricopeptide repeat protein [Chlamydiae bacterium]|nr:tetratricopeptide repeat protein [Chlamydiota bacterium]MBI3267218.1 tetratricopeptide repeat protein [Chlamydiota bacterium]
MIKKITVVLSLFLFLIHPLSSFARWRDQGQSEKYFSFWEKKFEWEASAIEGYALLLDENYSIAREKLEKAISLGCPLGKVYFQLGLCFDKLNQRGEATENYKHSLDLLSKSDERDTQEYAFLAHYNLGVLWIEEGKDPEAVGEFEKAVQLKPQDASSYLNLGYLYSRNDMLEKAVDAYQKTIQYDPQAALAYYNLGIVLRHLGQSQEAQEHFSHAKTLDPTLEAKTQKAATESTEIKDPWNLTPEEVAEIRSRAQGVENLTAVGNLYFARNEFENALAMYDQALAADPSRAEAYTGRGQALLQLGRAWEAQKPLFKALELEPHQWNAHVQLGKVYYDLGRIQMARLEFEKAEAQNPNKIEVLFYLGVVHEYSGDRRYGKDFPASQAIQYYEKVLELAPDHMKARTNLGNVYAKTGDWERAKKEFEWASQYAANCAYAHYNLGYIYDEMGLRRQSIDEYFKAIGLDPKLTDAYFNLGYVYSEYKLFKFAEKQYYKVLDIDKNYSDAYFNLGVLYDRYLKEKEKAHTYYHEYALRCPNAPIDERKTLKKRIIKLYP